MSPHVMDQEVALVTGASGFIGRTLVDTLIDSGARVRAVARQPRQPGGNGVEWACADIRDEKAIRAAAAGVSTVFHLAARVHAFEGGPADAAAHWSVNLEGTRNVVNATASCGATRLVFFSSVKAMGERTTALVDETAPARPVSAYGQSKLAAEQLVRQMGEAAGIHTVCLRLPMVWGPGADGNLGRMIAAIAAGRFPPMPEFGNRRSLVHVRDVVQAAMLAARGDCAASRIYLVTDGLGYSTREMYALICQALGRSVPTWSTPRWGLRLIAWLGDGIGRLVNKPGRIFDSAAFDKLADSAWYDCTAIRRELGYVPSVTLQTGLPEYITWMKAQTFASRAA